MESKVRRGIISHDSIAQGNLWQQDADVDITILQTERHIPDMIVSGGQSGADYGALLGAKSRGICTGGYAPRDFKTENGPKPDLGRVFGLIALDSDDYDIRTEWNIYVCDAVVVVARDPYSTGSALTRRLAHEYRKPLFEVAFPFGKAPESPFLEQDLASWLLYHTPGIVMFAGNRESKARGIEDWTRKLVVSLFS